MSESIQFCVDLYNKSRMKGDFHVRFCEGLGVKFPLPTRPSNRYAKFAFRQLDNEIMKFSSLNLPENCLEYIERIDSLQEIYNSIKFESIFEPFQLRQVFNGKMKVAITSYLDLNAWQKEIAYSCIVKMRTTEKSIFNALKNKDIYGLAILLRHHMENAGMLALTVEVLLKSFENNDFEILNKYISKTLFGNSFYNKPIFRDSDEAFATIETVTISAMINALDNFLKTLDTIENESKLKTFKRNYTWLCQFAHPNVASSCFFTETKELRNGTNVDFKWDCNFAEEEGLFRLLNILFFNMVFGLTNYYIFLSYNFMEDMSVTQDEDLVMFAYHEILNRFNN